MMAGFDFRGLMKHSFRGTSFTEIYRQWVEARMPERAIFYNAKSSGMIDIKRVFDVTVEGEIELKELIVRQGWRSIENNDERVWAIAGYVNGRLRYVNDRQNYGKPEFWADPYTTWFYKEDDCDGFACLIAWLAWNSGIPRSRLWVEAGDVQVGKGAKTGGHAYCVYVAEKDNWQYVVEGSYYAREARSNFLKGKRKLQNSRYKSVWWRTTDKKSFSNIGEVEILRGD